MNIELLLPNSAMVTLLLRCTTLNAHFTVGKLPDKSFVHKIAVNVVGRGGLWLTTLTTLTVITNITIITCTRTITTSIITILMGMSGTISITNLYITMAIILECIASGVVIMMDTGKNSFLKNASLSS